MTLKNGYENQTTDIVMKEHLKGTRDMGVVDTVKMEGVSRR